LFLVHIYPDWTIANVGKYSTSFTKLSNQLDSSYLFASYLA
jgi:hypothetical protein